MAKKRTFDDIYAEQFGKQLPAHFFDKLEPPIITAENVAKWMKRKK